MLMQKEPTGKFPRWVAFLQQFSYDIKHRARAIHNNADALNRCEYESSKENTTLTLTTTEESTHQVTINALTHSNSHVTFTAR